MAVSCDHCGSLHQGDHPPLTWSLSVDGGRVRRYCESCTRDNVRSMEGKLDENYW